MDQEKKITIMDVARKAGVSKGTVDRVLHSRGEVAAESAERVLEAVRELGYEPNLHASLLATRRAHSIACLMPKFQKGEYWEKIYTGFMKGGADVAALGVGTRVFFYDQYNEQSFKGAAEEMLESNPSAVVMPPLFVSETTELCSVLDEKRIPYVFVDGRIDSTNYHAFYGMSMSRSGNLCGCMLDILMKGDIPCNIALVRLTRDKSANLDPTARRREGFLNYMKEKHPDAKIENIWVKADDPRATYDALEEFFDEHPDFRIVIMFNSRVHICGDYLLDNPDDERIVIGFDDLDRNMEMLSSGLITMLIADHSEDLSRRAVSTLSDAILLRKMPERRDNHTHMDILTPLNVEDY